MNPLHHLHQQANAEFQRYGEIEIVSTFGVPQAEYAAIRKSCGLMDLPQRGILELTGHDRLSFLNNLLTNQTWSKETKSGLASGSGVYAFLLNVKGRIAADMKVLELGERTWLEMDRRLVEPVRAILARYLFSEQVKLNSRIDSLDEMALHGPAAQQVLSVLIDSPLPELTPLASFACRILDVDVIIWRDDIAAVPGFQLIIPIDSAVKVWTELNDRFGQSTQLGKRLLRPVGWAAFNATRIEAGRALFGIDFDDTVLPAETGNLFTRAVSLTKGCYLGQEIVARMHARGQLARLIVGIRMESDALPIAGAKIFDDAGNEIGGVTSSTISPILSGAAIALGYVRRAHSEPGTKLKIPAEGALREGIVVDLPFLE